MAHALSDEGRWLLKLLADEQWHPYPEVFDAVTATVAPGKAWRRYEAVAANRELHYGPRKGPDLADDEKIKSGRRAIVTDLMSSLRKRYIEIREVDGVREVRRRAEVPPVVNPRARRPADDPPAPAPDPPAPADRDDDLADRDDDGADDGADDGGGPAVAFFSEDQVRAIVADEVAVEIDAALADFQDGMQRWLTDRFADLERHLDRRRGGNQALPRDLRRGRRG